MTNRQYLAWMEWLAEEWNRPDRTDHYLMLLAAETRAGRVKNPKNIKLEHFKLRFGSQKPLSVEQATEISKARWALIPKSSRVPCEEGGDPQT